MAISSGPACTGSFCEWPVKEFTGFIYSFASNMLINHDIFPSGV